MPRDGTAWQAGGVVFVLRVLRDLRLVDYSPGGVGFLLASPPATGDQFIVSVPLPGGAAVTRLCEVANVARAEGGVSRVGARFVPFSARHGRGWLARVCDWIA